MDIYLAIVSTFLMLYVMLNVLFIKNKREVHFMFFLTILCTLIWNTCGLILSLFFPDRMTEFVFMSFLGISLSPPFFLLTAYFFTHTEKRLQLLHALLFLVPLMTLILAYTNDHHRLFVIHQEFMMTSNQYGPYFLIHSFYSYGCLALGLIYLMNFAIKNSGLFSLAKRY